ncbi:uncharacterized protein CIMG_12387 [Coccidioides immitis RS]|uniref:Uncharacterized protein n=1 Tax=Coccidioides immitis (strain RS) TaxID=246410 RepID=A0A0D8JSX4_COCIM|nr:uncharacterized protein CIMG_12387 [Coccidioides immitis RS]KJF60450.1 hypothetical protein CIMG_12387 [Coccidioides immitis RS]
MATFPTTATSDGGYSRPCLPLGRLIRNGGTNPKSPRHKRWVASPTSVKHVYFVGQGQRQGSERDRNQGKLQFSGLQGHEGSIKTQCSQRIERLKLTEDELSFWNLRWHARQDGTALMFPNTEGYYPESSILDARRHLIGVRSSAPESWFFKDKSFCNVQCT